jgi:branched-chain amino acid transport system substrate-binding protein
MKRWFHLARRIGVCLVFAGGLSMTASVASAVPVAKGSEQFIPMLTFRVGPYGIVGSAFGAGTIDYMDMLNKRDGGINGVKLTWEECEFEYKTELGLECYEKLIKSRGPNGAAVVMPFSTSLAYALLDKVVLDKVPMVTVGYGKADATDGSISPYVFPIVTNYWSQASAIIKYIGLRSGGLKRLKGKKIGYLYHDSPFGKEGVAVTEKMAKKYGFEMVYVPVKPPGKEQDAEWAQIKQAAPDWVILWGLGAMNPAALMTAQKVKYPASRIVGIWWAGAEEDVRPAGDAARGYTAAAFHLSGDLFPVIQDIKKLVYAGGKKGAIDETGRIGQTYYNRGVVQGILITEAIRKAQERFGNKPLTGEQLRWGLENLAIGELRINKLGAWGLMQPIKLSCDDHEGGGAVRFQRWSGTEWAPITGWIESEKDVVRPMIEESAMKYAKDKSITRRDCAKEAS